MNQQIEEIRENLSPTQVLQIRQEAKRVGATVNVRRLHSELVYIEIIYPNKVIDVTPKRLG